MKKARAKKSHNSNTYSLDGRTVLITGVNGQLGSVYLEYFLRHGARVYATDMQDEVSSDLAKRLTKAKLTQWSYHKVDVRDEDSIRATVQKIDALDVLVNNAGTSVFTPFEERTAEEIQFVTDVNIKGTILCAKVCAEKMGKKRQGSIINIGSIYGVVPMDKKIYGDSGRNNSEVYGGTKAGIIQMSRYLAAYLGEKNIRVNSVSPGGVFAHQKQFFIDNYVRKTPLGRMAEPDDIASAILFLSSDDARDITGQNITVDSGFSLNQ